MTGCVHSIDDNYITGLLLLLGMDRIAKVLVCYFFGKPSLTSAFKFGVKRLIQTKAQIFQDDYFSISRAES